MGIDELIFFVKVPGAIPLYETVREMIHSEFESVSVKMHKKQISFSNRHNFAFASLPLCKVKNVIKPGGYILIDEGYLPESITQSDVKCSSYELLIGKQWAALFDEAGLALIETVSDKDAEIPASGDSDTGMAFITARANELTLKHPDKKAIFDGYVRGQQNEYDDIKNTITCVTRMLRKV